MKRLALSAVFLAAAPAIAWEPRGPYVHTVLSTTDEASPPAAAPDQAAPAPAPATPPAPAPLDPDQPRGVPAPPPAAPAPLIPPAPPLPAPTSPTTEATVTALRPGRPRWRVGEWLLSIHAVGGIEQGQRSSDIDRDGHFVCTTAAIATCTVAAFGVGGQLLWRGFLGPALAFYASAGSPLVPDGAPAYDPSTVVRGSTHAGLADRLSIVPALAIRPLAWFAWDRGDRYLARLLGGLSFEVGPSIEHLRTGSKDLPGCGVPTNDTRLGFHALAALDVPLLGDSRSGWLALRLGLRVLAGANTGLAPAQGASDPACYATIIEPGSAQQFLAGFAYSL